MGGDLPVLKQIANNAETRFNQNRAHKHYVPRDLGIVIMGRSATGKTSLVNYLQRKPFSEEYSQSAGAESFEGMLLGKWLIILPKKALLTTDAGYHFEGNYSLAGQMVRKHRPHGVVFMVDHKNLGSHGKFLDSFATFVSSEPNVRGRLSTVLLLLNKWDLWKYPSLGADAPNREYVSQDDIEVALQDGISILETAGVTVIIKPCSLKECDGVDDAIEDFMTSIIERNE
jgi:GTPase SAR1 family protein